MANRESPGAPSVLHLGLSRHRDQQNQQFSPAAALRASFGVGKTRKQYLGFAGRLDPRGKLRRVASLTLRVGSGVGAGFVGPLRSHVQIELQADEVRCTGVDGVRAAVRSGTMRRAMHTAHIAGSGSVTVSSGVGETRAAV
ncbi:hypothetical protein NDU88_000491 [Pleurodeles waltl]|uniref:Uncharacterized protein n=1 Tax=Pleurodeles waltl TaxID=8319 RepID=A0AAV7SWT0_PLEWA|nr:hypothetical protein NDU88_000491 [Pleurodeles waltl]